MQEGNGQLDYGPSYIEDGYTATGYCKGVPGLYEPCRFVYRPMLILQHAQVSQRLESCAGNVEQRWQVICSWLSKQIIHWDMTKRKSGESVNPNTVAELLHVAPMQLQKIWHIVLGELPTDPDPTGFSDLDADRIVAETQHREIPDRELADQKN